MRRLKIKKEVEKEAEKNEKELGSLQRKKFSGGEWDEEIYIPISELGRHASTIVPSYFGRFVWALCLRRTGYDLCFLVWVIIVYVFHTPGSDVSWIPWPWQHE